MSINRFVSSTKSHLCRLTDIYMITLGFDFVCMSPCICIFDRLLFVEGHYIPRYALYALFLPFRHVRSMRGQVFTQTCT